MYVCARYRTRTDTSWRVAFKATVSTVSPSGRVSALVELYCWVCPEADLNCQNTDPKSVTSTIPSSGLITIYKMLPPVGLEPTERRF